LSDTFDGALARAKDLTKDLAIDDHDMAKGQVYDDFADRTLRFFDTGTISSFAYNDEDLYTLVVVLLQFCTDPLTAIANSKLRIAGKVVPKEGKDIRYFPGTHIYRELVAQIGFMLRQIELAGIKIPVPAVLGLIGVVANLAQYAERTRVLTDPNHPPESPKDEDEQMKLELIQEAAKISLKHQKLLQMITTTLGVASSGGLIYLLLKNRSEE